jgi:hypothetical protein
MMEKQPTTRLPSAGIIRSLFRYRCCFLLASALLCGPLLGQTAPAPAPKRVHVAKNPFAGLIILPFEFDISRPIGNYSRSQYQFSLTPVIPVPLGPKWDLITQSNIPVVSQPELTGPRGRAWALSDITSSFYLSPDNDSMVQWAVGPTILFPAAVDPRVGTGKWGAGPAVAVFAEPGKWTLGVQVSDLRSFAGDRNRSDVHYMSLRYHVTYNAPKGWYVTTAPQTQADWTAPRGDRWLMPVGFGVGKALTIAKRQTSAEVDGHYNVIHPRTLPYPKWVITLQITFSWGDFL